MFRSVIKIPCQVLFSPYVLLQAQQESQKRLKIEHLLTQMQVYASLYVCFVICVICVRFNDVFVIGCIVSVVYV